MEFQKSFSELWLINYVLFEAFYVVLKATNLSQSSIPPQYFRFEDRAIKRYYHTNLEVEPRFNRGDVNYTPNFGDKQGQTGDEG